MFDLIKLFFNPLSFCDSLKFWDVGSIIGAGASIAGGLMGSDAASSAADAQLAASNAATAEQRREYDQNRADLAPGRALYTGATGRLAELLGLDTGNNTGTAATSGFTPLSFDQWAKSQPAAGPTFTSVPGMINGGYYGGGVSGGPTQEQYQKYLAANPATAGTSATTGQHSADFGSLLKNFSQSDLENDPVYQSGLKFGLDQGTGAIDARARASGSSDSGSVLKELTRFANDYGSTKANDAYNRFNTNRQTNYNFLSGAAGLGQNSTNATVQAGQNMANNVSNNILGAGNARSAGIIGGANSWSNALSGLANQNWGNMFGNPNTSLSSSLYSKPGSFASNFTG